MLQDSWFATNKKNSMKHTRTHTRTSIKQQQRMFYATFNDILRIEILNIIHTALSGLLVIHVQIQNIIKTTKYAINTRFGPKEKEILRMYTRRKTETHQYGSKCFPIFSDLDKRIFQRFHLYSSTAQSSNSLYPKIHLIRSKWESEISLEIWEGPKSNVTNVVI